MTDSPASTATVNTDTDTAKNTATDTVTAMVTVTDTVMATAKMTARIIRLQKSRCARPTREMNNFDGVFTSKGVY